MPGASAGRRRSVAVTQAPDRVSKLATALQQHGVRVVEVPTVRTVPVANAVVVERVTDSWNLGAWVVISSPTAARILVDSLDPTAFQQVRVVALGPGTQAALESAGVVVAAVPKRYVAEGVLDLFDSVSRDDPVVICGSALARPVLRDGLVARGFCVDAVVTHTTESAALSPASRAELQRGVDVAAFASSSAVTGFVQAVPQEWWPRVAACIGPITGATAHEVGFKEVRVADVHSIDGLVETVLGS